MKGGRCVYSEIESSIFDFLGLFVDCVATGGVMVVAGIHFSCYVGGLLL